MSHSYYPSIFGTLLPKKMIAPLNFNTRYYFLSLSLYFLLILLIDILPIRKISWTFMKINTGNKKQKQHHQQQR